MRSELVTTLILGVVVGVIITSITGWTLIKRALKKIQS